MARIVPIIFAVALWVFGIIDCARMPKDLMPGRLPKWVWMLLNIFVPVIGNIVWLVFIWPYRHPDSDGYFGGFTRPSRPQPSEPVAPDDDPEFLARLDAENRFREWERQQEEQDGDDGAPAAR
ncbi:MAG: PLDc_N domain-containing protein [Actinomycetaceae bacterium]|jgi:hypothetical protein|nr:PLDc_N domain-containing protein [Actinomycetaceae bacterium]